jgi:hypothetical protein
MTMMMMMMMIFDDEKCNGGYQLDDDDVWWTWTFFWVCWVVSDGLPRAAIVDVCVENTHTPQKNAQK